MTYNLFFWGDIMVCQLYWCFDSESQARTQDLSTVTSLIGHLLFHWSPKEFSSDHLPAIQLVLLQNAWHRFCVCVCAHVRMHTHVHAHTHTKLTHSSECSELICMPATFVCYLLNCPQWSDITHVCILATFLLFLNAAGLPASLELVIPVIHSRFLRASRP